MVLMSSKGYEGYQIVGERKIPFKDQKVIANLLNEYSF
jgi:UDP-N-acetylmuramyl tripeptide synthase